ncbi:MAG: Unknown protein [uncultured Sulfurovum sp.]|uniref:Elongation factor 1 beta central acidic region eukaryote domain-containing protein n=1 Tax=uncultured Sulfurovum sp. TaxID=269237 RepID=A0A6S6TP01_9BACT|nr:MAG: Unknown protein [uncultured Sulfurovum sp.]
MSGVNTKLDKAMPTLERLAKIKKLFSSSTTFWTVTRILMPFLVSQLIALAWNEKLSAVVMSLVKDMPSWVQSIAELLVMYFEKGGDWLFVWVILFVIVLMVFVKLIDKEERTKHGFFFLAGFVLFFTSILLFVLPMQSSKLDKIQKTNEEILKDKTTENYLVQRIKQLESQLLQSSSNEEIERLVDEVSSLKLELLALQINDKVIDEAQVIIKTEAKEGVPKALELIEKSNPKSQIVKLREQMQKQAKISRYKASLYEWVHQWEKADSAYLEAIEFTPNYDNYFDYAYFSQVYRADFQQADKFYRMALNKTESLSSRATIFNNLGLFHSKDSTKRAEALAMYEEALKIYRALVKENSKVYLPYVAGSLNNLGLFHSKDSTKRAEALAMYEEALKIYRALAKENPKVYLPYVASSLNNLGAFHSDDSTKRTEALAMYKEALEVRRALAKENPKVYLPYVAGSLNNLGLFHSKDSTKRAEALAMYEEALKIYRALAKENPKVYLPYVAGSVNNLGLFHSKDSTKRAEALAMYEEALEVRRALAKENPKVYLPDVAMSLNNLGLFHSDDSTKRAEALAMYEEALEVRRALAKENPKVYLPDVAMSLNNLGIFHSDDSTKRAEALAMYEEALKIYRALAKENPKVYGRECATTLVMGVYSFGANKEQLGEALRLLEPYPDNYGNVGGLRQMILQLKEAR